jgi:hypothetical protein
MPKAKNKSICGTKSIVASQISTLTKLELGFIDFSIGSLFREVVIIVMLIIPIDPALENQSLLTV